jgi:hypothetical protein
MITLWQQLQQNQNMYPGLKNSKLPTPVKSYSRPSKVDEVSH